MAYIRQIQIQGFKSFSPRKASINLSKGFTAIVGENGCGKSNILDAVCFVLGRLSSKSLRAENFASLLFNGGKDLSPAKICRVSLVFDNTDRQFPIDANEVTISREVDDTGISAYRIGGKRVTRTEMLDTIAVAGVHPEGHNIVMQNELANVIGMSPPEIRQIVEGVAGISVFDEKKQQIESELVKVDHNLQIVQVRTEEIRQEYTRVERDRDDALRWREITDQIQRLDRDLVFAELARVEERLNEMKEEFSHYSKNIEDFETQRREGRNRKQDLEKSMQANLAKIKALDQQVHEKEIEATRNREILKGLNLASEKIMAQIESLSASADHIKSEEAAAKEQLEKLDQVISVLKGEEAKLNDQITPLRDRFSILSEQTSSPDNEYLTLREQILALTDNIERKRSDLGETSALRQVTEKEISNLKQQIDESYKHLSKQERAFQEATINNQRIEKEVKQLHEEISRLQKQEKELNTSVVEKQKKQADLTKLIQESREELLEAQTRLKTIHEFKKYGFAKKAATDAVLKYVKENKVSGVFGTLGSLGQTSTKYATALEVAGGGRLDFIVVDNEETATKCIDYLKKSRAGRATFIPLNSIKTDSFTYKEGQKGVVGNAIDLLTFDESFRPAFDYVFGRTLIVKDLNVARNIELPHVRKITIDGDIVEPNRTLTGGYYKGITSLTLEEEARIPELQKKLKELRELQNKTEREYQQWKAKLDQLDEQIRGKQKQAEQMEVKSRQTANAVSAQEESLNTFKASITKLHESLQGDERAKIALDEKLQSTESGIDALTAQREEYQQKLSEIERSSLDPNLIGLRSQLDEFESQLREIQLELTSKTSEAKHAKIEQKRISQDLTNSKRELNQAKTELSTNKNEMLHYQKQLAEIEDTINDSEAQIRDLENQISSSETESHTLEALVDGLIDKINDEKLNQSRLEGRIENWEERYNTQKEKVKGLEPPEIPIDPNTVNSIRKHLASLQEEREKLGLINQKAVERFEEIRHAYDEILEKEKRIRDEREAILDAMRRAEEEKFRVFMAAFNSISNNFSDVYQKLTQGEGQLELENPENPFLGGVRMKVRPAGKRVQYLDALSGGEKALTALTFMFALQLHQPAPFYFLDEIDEALDPNNADRVAKLIKTLSENSQFIIISHNEITIRLADILLGVAMLDGISKVFSVKFEEGMLLIDGKS